MADIDPGMLKRVTVFSSLTPDQLEKLAAAATLTVHAEGEEIASEGTVGRRFHLLLDGGAVVERGRERVATVRAGEFVGEVALLGGGKSTATVRCTAPTRCLTIEREPFWALLEEEPAIALRILEIVCRRLELQALPATANLSG
ncbi:MAG TPA: cyclic nucleotide-binding domain-containing protein [Actinomycetota bacterium]|nr:cyclic nucleotide-binding domain-containing protein [Actinomycetota bacterium]